MADDEAISSVGAAGLLRRCPPPATLRSRSRLRLLAMTRVGTTGLLPRCPPPATLRSRSRLRLLAMTRKMGWKQHESESADPHPGAVAGRPDRGVGVGENDVCPQTLPAYRGDLLGLLPRVGQRRRDRPDVQQRCVRGPALHRGQVAGARAAGGYRCHERPARVAQAVARIGAHVSRPPGRPGVRSARAGLPRAQPRAPRPQLRPARGRAAVQPAAPVAARPQTRAVSARFRAEIARGG